MNEQPVVVTPPVETPEPEKVTFSDEQKARINEIVREASARAGAEARAETERLRKLVPATPAEPQSTDTLLRLAEAQAELTSLKSAAAENQISQVLHKAVAKENFFDNDLAAQILRSSVKMVDGKPVIVDASGAVRLNANFDPLTPAEAAFELATVKPYLVRSGFVGGSGSVSGGGPRAETGPALETIFGRNSDGGAANRLAMRNPKAYAAMKVRARAAGLVP